MRPELPRAVRLDFPARSPLAPVSLAAAFVAGAANGASISLAPVYALQIGVDPRAVPLFTSAIVIGSALGVYPVGRLSDRIDRRAHHGGRDGRRRGDGIRAGARRSRTASR